MTELLAILALATFTSAWAVQTVQVLETKKKIGNVVADTLFFAGLVLFTMHSFNINDPWFIFFNSAATVLALINWYYIPNKQLALKKELLNAENFVEKEVVGYRQKYSHKSKKRRK
jgi:hypothetical protein